MSASLIIEFDRIGRVANVPPLRVASRQGEAHVASEVHRYAAKFLASKSFGVTVELPFGDEPGWVKIDGGRFGAGVVRFERVPALA